MNSEFFVGYVYDNEEGRVIGWSKFYKNYEDAEKKAVALGKRKLGVTMFNLLRNNGRIEVIIK